ncbi:hypothetical protein [Actinoplanes teichomyceticus]|uniref:Uncharacterized protein n=1 Tax=Actinoplanes teichomyceticus TaxID=1867 RepID=A0A561WS74_ACTTI|nr:hypothetical protein [Actinoplanes teichomyceticus]TWG26721.1 hypothetical protein FHX34_1011718 [Actinoplanes teichomyceticus]GIF15120.1 hypothetical protein Ate01nite_51520 [Actinoplanes teichomyceticus]
MTETGWPLIPREVLPPPTPVERRPHRRGEPGPAGGRQLPMFGAETVEPSPADLAGLLAGPGRLGRMGGTARVSVVVDDAWRVHVLVAELVARGLTVTWAPVAQTPGTPAPDRPAGEPPAPAVADTPGSPGGKTAGSPGADMPGSPGADMPEPAAGESPGPPVPDEISDTPEEPSPPRFEVRTSYSRRLNTLARAWPEAAAQLFLSGPRLRLWVAAAGVARPGGYRLGLDPAKDPRAVDAALVRAGLGGRVSDDGRGYLIAGRRRLARLAELVGERPEAAPADVWPGGAGA